MSASLSSFILLAALASSAATQQSAFSHHLPDAAPHDSSIATVQQQPPNNRSIAEIEVTPRVNTSEKSTLEPGPSSASDISSTEGTYGTGIWTISPTLALDIDIGKWRLSPESVLGTLEAAEIAVGKKQATALLEETFTQRTGSRLNMMIFDIGPAKKDERKLSWGDVAEVLGEERGLPRFFRETKEWRNVDFGLFHIEKGLLGVGWIRKWYMLDHERNGTGLETA